VSHEERHEFEVGFEHGLEKGKLVFVGVFEDVRALDGGKGLSGEEGFDGVAIDRNIAERCFIGFHVKDGDTLHGIRMAERQDDDTADVLAIFEKVEGFPGDRSAIEVASMGNDNSDDAP